MNLFRTTAKHKHAIPLQSMMRQILNKSKVIMEMEGKGSVEIPVGTEWSNLEYQPGIQIKEIKGYRDNERSILLMVEAVKGTRVATHWHQNSETIMCVKGALYCPLNDMMVKMGKTWEIPPRLPHAWEFLEDTLLAVMWHPRFD